MPSVRKAVGYRPDETEEQLLKQLAYKLGLPISRVIGTAVRQLAAREGVEAQRTEAGTDSSVPKG